MMAFYVPKGAIKRGESVLVVDDVIRTGETQNALINLVQRCRAETAGVYTLVAIGENAESKIQAPPGCKVEAVIKVKPKQASAQVQV